MRAAVKTSGNILKNDSTHMNKNAEQMHSKNRQEKKNSYAGNSFDFSQISILPSSISMIQPKLKINSPNDKYEQEADRIADKVAHMSDLDSLTRVGNKSIQRKPLADEITGIGSFKAQRKCVKCEEEEEKLIQRKALNNAPNMVNQSLSIQLQSSRGKGHQLDSKTNSYMSSRFGVDFDHIRIHNDSRAAEMNEGINAKAFTIGNDIYFNEGQYYPGSDEGKHLLAHELTHVLQQGQSQAVSIIQRERELDSTEEVEMNKLTVIELLKLQSERNSRERGFIDFDLEREIAHVNLALTKEEIFAPIIVKVKRTPNDPKYQGTPDDYRLSGGVYEENYTYDPGTDSFEGLTHEESCNLACQKYELSGLPIEVTKICLAKCVDADKLWEGLAAELEAVKIYWDKKMGVHKQVNLLTRERFKVAERQLPPLPLGIYDYYIINNVPQIPKDVIDYIFYWRG